MTPLRPSTLLAVVAFMFALGLSGCGGRVTGVDTHPRATDYEIFGIDVSKYQGDIDWNAVRASGVKFAWIKATEGGDHLDSKFHQNWQEAKAAGIKRGAYHFVYWCRPGHEQASWFLSNVPHDPDALPPVLDVEWNGSSKTCPKKIPRELAQAQMRTILAAMERAYGKRPVIYTSVDFHRDVMVNEFTDYPIWVRSVKYHPSVKYGNRRWHFWQHTAEARVPGIHGFVDRNTFNGSARDWLAWLRPSEMHQSQPVTTTASIHKPSAQPVAEQLPAPANPSLPNSAPQSAVVAGVKAQAPVAPITASVSPAGAFQPVHTQGNSVSGNKVASSSKIPLTGAVTAPVPAGLIPSPAPLPPLETSRSVAAR